MGVDEEGLIICPTEVFAGASSVTATASPSEALRFFLDFFSVDLVRENGWYYVLEHEGLGEMCDAVAVQNSSRYPTEKQTRAAGTRHHPIKSCQSTHLILPYLSIIKSSMGILQLFLSVLQGGASIQLSLARNAERNDHAITRLHAMRDAMVDRDRRDGRSPSVS